jgi:26S proteasome regulatory subunit N1
VFVHDHRPGFLPADGRQPQGAALDSARQNLASTFVNAFVNAGYGQDKLVTVSTEGQSDSGALVKY